MAISLTFHNEAHSYHFDNMDVNELYAFKNAEILGASYETVASWTGLLLPGQTGEISTIHSNGFTIKRTIQNIDGLTAKIISESVFKTDTDELLLQIDGERIFSLQVVSINLQANKVFAADDVLNGNDFNNVLRGYGGNDRIDGRKGIDVAYFSGFGEDYKVSVKINNEISIEGNDGIDLLINIERLHFDDEWLAFDLNGNAGLVSKMIGAVFGHENLVNTTNVGTFLNLLDNGFSYSELMELALTIRLGAEFTDTQVVKLLYENLLGIEPSNSEIAFWTSKISSGEYTPVSLATMAANTAINKQNIDLDGLSKTGLNYANASTTVPLTSLNHIDSLLGHYKWGEGIHTGANITYSFRTDTSIYSSDEILGYGAPDGNGEPWQTDGIAFLDLEQIEGFKTSLEAWAEYANIRLTEIKDSATASGDIRISTLPGVTSSITYQPDLSTRGGDIWLAISNDLNTVTKGSSGYATFLRETGHALGLEHPDEGRVIADKSIDALPFSVMSKRDFINDSLNNKRDILYPTTPMLNDIAAIQYLYGANLETRNDNTIYSWLPDQVIYETIWDGDGTDTIDWSNQTSSAEINLAGGTWSYLGPYRWDGHTNTNMNLAIAYNAIIENANGGSGDDILTGNSIGNFLNGGDGNDELHGGEGTDYFDFESSMRAGNDTMYGGPDDDIYVLDSLDDTVVELEDEGNDIIWSELTYSLENLENVEKLFLFGSASINATGNALANELRGNSYDNILEGKEGNDTLVGVAGNNRLKGDEGIDTAIYLEAIDDYNIIISDLAWQIESKTGEIDNLTDIERLKFLDTNIALDLDGNAGKVVKVIGAVLGKKTIEKKELVRVGLNLVDNGMDYDALIALALKFKLGNGFTNSDEVKLLYQNLLGITPSQAHLDFWTNKLESGQFTQTSLALFAADHDINTANIDLIGLSQTGIAYI